MSIEIHPSGDYLAEILHTWGLHDVARDVWLLPAGAKVDAGEVETRARAGAIVIAIISLAKGQHRIEAVYGG
jgi:hypothetical protein